MFKLYRFHINVLLSTWLVVACMLGLQLGRNYLKYQSLVIETTAARLQIAGGTIETVARRAEQVGLGLDEIRNLDTIIDREMRREPLIDTIRILTVTGEEISSTAMTPLPQADLNRLLRRITVQDADTARIEIADALYSARMNIDTTGVTIGAVVISTNRGNYHAEELRAWLASMGSSTLVIEPGSPWQNAFVESFNGTLLDELLDIEMFTSLAAERYLADAWRTEYNQFRPHSSLAYQTPAEFAAPCAGTRAT